MQHVGWMLRASDVNGGGDYIFPHAPVESKMIQPEIRTSSLDTFRSSAIFNWGFLPESSAGMVRGYRFEMNWKYMRKDFWENLKKYYESTGPLRFYCGLEYNPGMASYDEWDVMPISLTSRDMPQNMTHKRDVKMVVEITEVYD